MSSTVAFAPEYPKSHRYIRLVLLLVLLFFATFRLDYAVIDKASVAPSTSSQVEREHKQPDEEPLLGSQLLSGSWVRRNSTNPFTLSCPRFKTAAYYSCASLKDPNFRSKFRNYEWSPSTRDPDSPLYLVDDTDIEAMVQLLGQVGTLTFIGDSFARLLFETLVCFVQTLSREYFTIHEVPVEVDCSQRMVLYNESLETCRKNHGIASYEITDVVSRGIAFRWSFVWSPFLGPYSLVENGPNKNKPGYYRKLTLNTSTFPASHSQQLFFEESSQKNGTLVFFADQHWMASWYRIPKNDTDGVVKWLQGSREEMMDLQRQALHSTRKWVDQHSMDVLFIHEEQFLSRDTVADAGDSLAGTLPQPALVLKYPRKSNDTDGTNHSNTLLLDPPGGLESSLVKDHWCNEFVPWQLVRVILAFAKSKK